MSLIMQVMYISLQKNYRKQVLEFLCTLFRFSILPTGRNFILTLAEGAEAVRKIGSGRIGLLADTLHMIGSGEDPKQVVTGQFGLIRHVHISEPQRVMPVNAYSPECLAFVRAFAAAGYDGTICFETKCADYADLAAALKTLKEAWKS